MKDFGLGKKLYKSRALFPAKVFLLVVSFILMINMYYSTLSDDDFIKMGGKGFYDVINFHITYPEELLTFLVLIIAPTIYYGFIRGIVFFEKGIVINRGLPFFNHSVAFDDIKEYKMINPKFLMSIVRKDTDDEILFTICDPDRGVAIMDQQGIPGQLGSEEHLGQMSSQKKFVILVLFFGMVIFILQRFSLLGYLYR
jgi:hypothetical protein